MLTCKSIVFNPDCESDCDELYSLFSEDRTAENPKKLSEWVGKYPAFRTLLTQWAVETPICDYADTLPVNIVTQARTVTIAQEVLRLMRAV